MDNCPYLPKKAIFSLTVRLLHPKVKLRGALEGQTPFRVLWQHLRDLKWVYSWGSLSVLLTTLAEVGVPRIVKEAVDTLHRSASNAKLSTSAVDSTAFVPDLNQDKDQFYLYLGILVGLFALQFLGRIGWRIWIAQQAHHVGAQMKSLLWDRARFLPSKKLEQEYRPGDLMNVATADVNMGRFAYSFNLIMTSDMIFLIFLTLGMMFQISPTLTLWTLAVVSILPFLLHRLTKLEGIQHDQSQQSLSVLSDLSAQAVATARLQRLTQTSAYWRQKLNESAEDYMHKRKQVIDTGLKFLPITGLTPVVSYVILLSVGIQQVVGGQLSIGGFIAMQSYIFLVQVPLIELGSTVADWQRSYTSLKRLGKVYGESEERQLRDGGEATKATDSPVLSIQKLHYSLPDTSIALLEDFSLDLKPAERLGILGSVGSGKSTLLNLMGGLNQNFEGRIELWGKDVRTLSHEFLRSKIAVVPQKAFLFADTIRNNIRLDRNISDEEVWRLLEIAQVAADVRNFPQKLDTKLGEWGVTLSGGQKQRLTLARAISRKPELLLLDDCLSAVDTVTEEKILDALDAELKSTTLVWVAHRESTLKNCDNVIRLERNEQVELRSPRKKESHV